MFNVPGLGQIVTVDSKHIRIGNTVFVLTGQRRGKRGQVVISGELAQGSNMSLAKLFARFTGNMQLPDELAQITLNQLSFEATPTTGEFSFSGSSNNQANVSFGSVALPTGHITVTVSREVNGNSSIMRAAIALTSNADVTVFDGFTFVGGSELAFKWNPLSKNETEEPAPGNTWVVSGSLGAIILEADYQFDVAVAFTPKARTFTLEGKRTSEEPLLALDGIGSLDARGITLEISRLRRGEAPAEGEVQLDAENPTTWSISADCGLTLEVPTHFSQQGTLSITREHENVIFMYKATYSDLTIPLPIPERNIAMHLGLNQLSVQRQRNEVGAPPAWTFEANPAISFTDLPQWLDAIVDTITGTFKASSDGLAIGIERWIKPQFIDLPPITLAGSDTPLGTLVLDASNLVLNIGKTIDGSMDFGIGIPEELNHITGVDTNFFKTYENGNNDSIVRFRLTLDETTGLSFRALNSPLGFIADDPDMPGWSIADFGDFGAFRFMMPAFGYNGTAFDAQVGFEQIPERPLQIPLSPFKWLLSSAHLDGLNALIPDAIPVDGPDFFDANGAPQLEPFITRLERVSGITLPDAIHEALNSISGVLERLPQGLKDYLDFEVPTKFVLDIAISETGGARIDFSTADGSPLRLLTMAGTPLPSLMGIELHSFMLGEILTGALFVTDVDARVDIFDLVTLAAALALPLEDLPLIDSVNQLQRRIVIDKLFMLVVYETGIPLPIPLFFNEIALEYHGLEGAILQTHWAFPMPEPNISEILTTFAQFRRFFTERNYLLKTEDLPQDLDLRLTIGANYLQLPKYLGGKLLGTEESHTYSLWDAVAHVLNAAKTLSIDEIVRAIPLDIRSNHEHIDMYGVGLDVAWIVTTPHEFGESTYTKINLNETDAADVLQIIPHQSTADMPGLIVFLRGDLDILGAAQLDMIFGLAATQAGLSTAFRSHGQINGLLDVNWAGAFRLEPHNTPVFRLDSSFKLTVLEHLVLDGSVNISDQGLAIYGHLDLFPDGSPVDVTGDLNGTISSNALYINGDVNFKITDHFSLAAAHSTITQNGLVVDATLLGQGLHFELQRDNDATVLYATMNPINIESVFEIDRPQVYINTAHGLRVLGGIGVLGIHVDGELDYIDDRFRLLVEGSLFDLFEATVQIESELMDSSSNISVFAKMQSNFNSDLAERVISAMRAKRAELNTALQSAKVEVDRWQGELDKYDRQIADTKRNLQDAIDKDKQDLQNARNSLDGYKADVQRFKNQVDGRLADIKRNNDDVDNHLSSYITAVNNARNGVQAIQDEIDRAQAEYDANKAKFYLLVEISTLKDSKKVANGVLDLAVSALEKAKVGYNYISEAADTLLVGFEQSLQVANDALDAQNRLIAGLEQNIKDLGKQLDDALVYLGDLRNVADWSLNQAKQALNEFEQASGGLLDFLNQIVDWSIGGLVAVHEAHFNGSLNLVSGGQVNLSVELDFQGNRKQYSFDFNFYGLDDSAKHLAEIMLQDLTVAALPQPQVLF